MRFAAAVIPVLLASVPAGASPASDYPRIAEPMIFDMMRPLGAAKGELEANTLAQAPLGGPDRTLAWAPEIEYAFADGYAVEVELPFEGGRLAEYKVGLQGAFGTIDGGRGAHGVQYLGIYDRHEGRSRHSLLYMAGTRMGTRWSMMNMIGVDDIRPSRRAGANAALFNHALFYDASPATVTGVELNVRGGAERRVQLTPQVHHRLADKVSVQVGAGAVKERHEPVRPVAGLRVIREF